MSVIILGGDRIRYEVFGRGRPVIFLHGWFSPLRYWMPTLSNLQANYRVYAIDLYGYGDSAKNPAKYTLEHQIALIDDFMTGLGLVKSALVGHGLGALVAAEFARRYQERIPRLMVVSPPLFDTGDLDRRVPVARRILPGKPVVSRAPGRETFGSPFDAPPETGPNAPTVMSASAAMRAALLEAARARGVTGLPNPSGTHAPAGVPQSVPEVTLPRAEVMLAPGQNPLLPIFESASLESLLQRCFKRGEANLEKLSVELRQVDPRAAPEAARHFDSGWMLDTFRLLPIPTVIITGLEDPVMPPPSDAVWNYLTVDKENLLLPIQLPGVRHFPMLEDDRFLRLISSFLEISDISRIEVKERWRRRSR